MTTEKGKDEIKATSEPECDIKVWSGTCEQSEYTTPGDKYLCASCGKIASLNHEVHHEHFPHVSGDETQLS
jgi:hypothetical protein